MKECNYLAVSGSAYFYREQGKGEPVVLLHCSAGSHKQWSGLINMLSPNYKVYALDFLGYGKSSAFSPWQAGNNPDVAAVEALLDIIQQPARIIGHSYGGAVATMVAVS